MVGKQGQHQKPGQQGFSPKSKVIGEFVDKIPEIKMADIEKYRQSWKPQEGVREALSIAFRNPGKAMLLLEYTEGAPSKKKGAARLRVRSLTDQGYSEQNGWIIRAVDNRVYALYQGVR